MRDHDAVGTAGTVGQGLPRRGDPGPCFQPPQGKAVGVPGLAAHDGPAAVPGSLGPGTGLRSVGGTAGLLQEDAVGPLQAGAVNVRDTTHPDTYVDTEPTQDLGRLSGCHQERVTVARRDDKHVKGPLRTAHGPAWYQRGRCHQAVAAPGSGTSYRYRLWRLCRRCRAHPCVPSQSSWLSSLPAAAGRTPATASTHLPIVQSFLRARHIRRGQSLWPNRENAIAPALPQPPQHERRHPIETSTVRQRRHRPVPALGHPRQPAASAQAAPPEGAHEAAASTRHRPRSTKEYRGVTS